MEKAASRPVWSGAISFGLVTIPVKLFSAIREKRLHFRTLHDQDQVPLKQKMVCPADGKEVHPEHTVKGYEIEKDKFVIISQHDLDSAAPKSSKAIEIEDFVELDQIDPLFFDRPYFISPKPEGVKPYHLLRQAMETTKKVGIARVVMFNKQYLAAIRPLDGGLCMETMHFNDEVVAGDSVPGMDIKGKVDDRELKVAKQLIDSLTTEFDAGKYRDEFREKVLEVIERKAKGEDVVERREAEPKPKKGADLIAALEASLAKTKTVRRSDHGRAIHATATARRRRSA